MSESNTITDDDEGKTVVDSEGETIGTVTEVRGSTAYVDPDAGLTEQIMAKFGWEEGDGDDYPLQDDAIATITSDEIRLQESV